MPRHLVAVMAAAGLFAAGAAALAQPFPERDPMLQPVQFAFYTWGGHRYCWYDGGWKGPGWYWCGDPWRSGLGWGGPWGWHGWVGGHPRSWYAARGGFHGDRWAGGGWRGAGWHAGWRGARWHGGGRGWHGGGHRR